MAWQSPLPCGLLIPRKHKEDISRESVKCISKENMESRPCYAEGQNKHNRKRKNSATYQYQTISFSPNQMHLDGKFPPDPTCGDGVQHSGICKKVMPTGLKGAAHLLLCCRPQEELPCPLVYFILYFIASTFSSADMVFAGQFIILLIFLGSVFIPLYVVGKKYE